MGKARRSKVWGGVGVFLAVFLGMVGLSVGTALAIPGSGTQEDPWRIQSLEDFDEFAGDANYWDGHARLETDVNLAGRTYTTAVIAADTDETSAGFQGVAFTGVFDGGGHRILNLTIRGAGYLGLFGQVTSPASISNLALEVLAVNGTGYYVGGMCGTNGNWYQPCGGTILNCYSSGTVTGDEYVGGLVGHHGNLGNITHCYSTGTVTGEGMVGGLVGWTQGGSIVASYSTGTVTGGGSVGGLVGHHFNSSSMTASSITASYSTATVTGVGPVSCQVGGLVGANVGETSSITGSYSTGTVTGDSSVGGLVGGNSASITDSYSTGTVTGDGDVGGLVGWTWSGSIVASYSTGNVTGVGLLGTSVGGLVGNNNSGGVTASYCTGAVTGVENVGGLVGANEFGSITASYCTGTVTGDEGVGGLVGANEFHGIITASYSTGAVTGYSSLGGLVGSNDRYGSVTTSYSTGAVTGVEDVGGLAGLNDDGSITASFWDVNSSEQTGSDGGTGLTTAQMQTPAPFLDAGWDFTTTWDICENQSYPRLQWQIAPADLACPYGVTMIDFSIFGQAWQSAPLDENWNSTCDLDGDQHIGAGDLAIACDQWMEGM